MLHIFDLFVPLLHHNLSVLSAAFALAPIGLCLHTKLCWYASVHISQYLTIASALRQTLILQLCLYFLYCYCRSVP